MVRTGRTKSQHRRAAVTCSSAPQEGFSRHAAWQDALQDLGLDLQELPQPGPTVHELKAIASPPGEDNWYYLLHEGSDIPDGYYEGSGWFVVVDPSARKAAIVSYWHCSCYGPLEGVDWQNPKWSGTPDELVALARERRDPAMPGRKLLKQDYGWESWKLLFAAICAWDDVGRLLWSGTTGGLTRGKQRWLYDGMTADVASVAAVAAAATRIQAAFRGWRWRHSVLFNPATELGQARLRAEFAKFAAQD